ncbi:MAG: GTP-binding protein [Bilophila wadsworthia]
MAASGPVPLHIITGFLGSGKTTLLNRLLHAASGRKKVGVIVNEWGRINIDGRLIAHDGIELAELSTAGSFFAAACPPASYRRLSSSPDTPSTRYLSRLPAWRTPFPSRNCSPKWRS